MKQIQLSDGDVVSMHPNKTFAKAPMSTAKDLIRAMPDNHSDDELQKWINEGVSCKVLRETGGGWQKGRIKLALVFVPELDKSQSPNPSESQVEEING